jgi:hypothetical protein
MRGRRVPDGEFNEWLVADKIEPGDYGRMDRPSEQGLDSWWFCAPNGDIGRLSSEREPDGKGKHHEVEEHEDGTISVVPKPNNSNSINIVGAHGEWHGYIRHGVWEKC